MDPVFGFPSIVRFSWKTAETLIDDKGVKIEFEEVEPEEDPSLAKNPSIKQFFAQSTLSKENKNPKSVGRCKLVKDRNIESTTLTSFLSRPWILTHEHNEYVFNQVKWISTISTSNKTAIAD